MKLITFPHAGGFGSYYRPMKALEHDSLQVINYEYPGHVTRMRDPLFTEAEDALDYIYEELFGNGIHEDIVLFGHSLGAAIAAELAGRINKSRFKERLVGLVISSTVPASYFKPCSVNLNDPAAVIKYLEELGGTQSFVAHNKAFMDMYLKIVTADLGLFDNYSFSVIEEPLHCFLKVLYAEDDHYLQPIGCMADWAAISENYLGATTYLGGHFYLASQWESVIAETKTLLKQVELCRGRMAK